MHIDSTARIDRQFVRISEGLVHMRRVDATQPALTPLWLLHASPSSSRIDIYGAHTGARIACEFAVTYPARVRRVLLDGITEYDATLKQAILDHYAPAVTPDDYGRQFVWAFNFVRDQWLHFPYFMRDAQHRLERARLPLISAPTLFLRPRGELPTLNQAIDALLPGMQNAGVAGTDGCDADKAAVIADFLRSATPAPASHDAGR